MKQIKSFLPGYCDVVHVMETPKHDRPFSIYNKHSIELHQECRRFAFTKWNSVPLKAITNHFPPASLAGDEIWMLPAVRKFTLDPKGTELLIWLPPLVSTLFCTRQSFYDITNHLSISGGCWMCDTPPSEVLEAGLWNMDFNLVIRLFGQQVQGPV